LSISRRREPAAQRNRFRDCPQTLISRFYYTPDFIALPRLCRCRCIALPCEESIVSMRRCACLRLPIPSASRNSVAKLINAIPAFFSCCSTSVRNRISGSRSAAQPIRDVSLHALCAHGSCLENANRQSKLDTGSVLYLSLSLSLSLSLFISCLHPISISSRTGCAASATCE